MTILDLKCAQCGYAIITDVESTERKKIESMINKALGILMEEGLYAFALYTKSESIGDKPEKKTARMLHEKTYALLKDPEINLLTTAEYLTAIRGELAISIDKLLLAKELVERTLIYARYHAKTLGGE